MGDETRNSVTLPAALGDEGPAAQVLEEKYVLERLIGEGGMGRIWRARHKTLGSPVAIKLLRGGISDRARQRFLTEARLAANLRSSNAVQVFDFGITSDGRPYLVMELLEGETLAHRIARTGALTPIETVRILACAARALDRAHRLGIVHRDFKPANVQLANDGDGRGTVKVLDFGVAKLVGALEEDEEEAHGVMLAPASVELSRTVGPIGTPSYMAPEQVARDMELTAAVDVWALGVVGYECLSGRRPFVASDETDLFLRIMRAECDPVSAKNETLSPEVDAWFAKVCAKSPEDRYLSAGQAVEALAIALFGLENAAAVLDSPGDGFVPFDDTGTLVSLDTLSSGVRSKRKVSVLDIVAIAMVLIAFAVALTLVLFAR